MIDADAFYLLLAMIVAFAAWFFLAPGDVAQLWERPDLPGHEIMRHFRYWEARRVLICGFSLAVCTGLATTLDRSVIPLIPMGLGLIALNAADAVQTHRLSRTLPSWSPGDEAVRFKGRAGAVIDILFGERPTGDGDGERRPD